MDLPFGAASFRFAGQSAAMLGSECVRCVHSAATCPHLLPLATAFTDMEDDEDEEDAELAAAEEAELEQDEDEDDGALDLEDGGVPPQLVSFFCFANSLGEVLADVGGALAL